ncbi:MAG: polyprenol monophosphomannose synthase [Candidatus Sumerlaeota bacterium]|nr:polyprenol monophosphomannose synthase [Candidatus Sumerlaeota bacterium]
MRVMAMLPTYNEAENIRPLLTEILALGPEYEALVVDDHSPDGTWKIVEEMAQADPRVHLVHRTAERGRGSAGVAGLLEAARLGADLVVEMDADFSHHPRHIPDLVKAEERADVVVGSRLVKGGGERGRSLARRFITRFANLYIRLVLWLPVRDCTSGFRVFRRSALMAMGLERMTSNGPAIVQEILLGARRAGCRFAEVPILFEERRAGRSTFNAKIMLAGLLAVLAFRFRRPRR